MNSRTVMTNENIDGIVKNIQKSYQKKILITNNAQKILKQYMEKEMEITVKNIIDQYNKYPYLINQNNCGYILKNELQNKNRNVNLNPVFYETTNNNNDNNNKIDLNKYFCL